MICPYCNHEVPGEYQFCLQCGAELKEDTIVQPSENTLVLPKTVASVRLDPTIAASLIPTSLFMMSRVKNKYHRLKRLTNESG